jgi:hypothetical protein
MLHAFESLIKNSIKNCVKTKLLNEFKNVLSKDFYEATKCNQRFIRLSVLDTKIETSFVRNHQALFKTEPITTQSGLNSKQKIV